MRAHSLVLLFLTALFAAPVSAALMPVDVTYSIEGLAQLTPIAVGSGMADVNAGGGGAHLTSLVVPGGLATAMSTSTPVSPSLPVTKLIATVGAATGAFAQTTGGQFVGPMPLTGNVRLCLAFNCLLFADVPLTLNGTRGVGIGPTPIVVDVAGIATLSLIGAAWTTGTATGSTSLGPISAMGFAQGPGSLTSSTAIPGGSLQMVTPIQVIATQGGVPLVIDFFGVFTAQLVPEPDSGLLLLSGAVALKLLRRARR